MSLFVLKDLRLYSQLSNSRFPPWFTLLRWTLSFTLQFIKRWTESYGFSDFLLSPLSPTLDLLLRGCQINAAMRKFWIAHIELWSIYLIMLHFVCSGYICISFCSYLSFQGRTQEVQDTVNTNKFGDIAFRDKDYNGAVEYFSIKGMVFYIMRGFIWIEP